MSGAMGEAGAIGADAATEQALRLVLCNAPPTHAEAIAKTLVEARLAACVNVLPGAKSFYRWEGKLTVDDEHVLLIKTRASLVAALTEAIRAAHPYSVPEIIALSIAPGEGNPDYLTWVLAETRAPTENTSRE